MRIFSSPVLLKRILPLVVAGQLLALLGACALAPGSEATPPAATPTAARAADSGDDMVLTDVTDLAQVAQLTGEDSLNDTAARFEIYGTDLGHMFEKDGQIYMVFGDTFACCIPGSGGPGGASDWRSNAMAIISDEEPADGLTFDDMITDEPGHAAQLIPPGRDDRTIIPTYGVALGDRMFLHYMAVQSWGDPGEWTLNESGLAYSDDNGQSWTKHPDARWDGSSNFGQVAIVKTEDSLYFFGIPGGRFGGVKLARVSHAAALDKSAYRYFSGMASGGSQWTQEEGQAALIVPPPVGELSVIWNPYLERWIMTYLDEELAAIVIREAPELWGPWSSAIELVSGQEYPSLYGAYMHPQYLENDGEIIYFSMSQWGPYNVFWMKARLIKR